jgi:SEC-C motif
VDCYNRGVPQDFKEQFKEQIGFLRSSSEAYDGGNEPEAKRLSVNLRVLVHDTRRSVSLLTHLDIKDELPFVDTAPPPPPPGVIPVFSGGLCQAQKTFGEGTKTQIVPVLDLDPERNAMPRQCFADWWETPVLHDHEGNAFSRKDFVLAVADQDGGAHVDAQLEPAYEALTRGNSMRMTTSTETTEDGWEVVMGGTFGGGPQPQVEPPTHGEPLANSIALASIRQIAHEMLIAVEAISWTEDGSATVSAPICQQPFLGADIPALEAEFGRNDLCPCGSGRKFKKCFLKKEPRQARQWADPLFPGLAA